MKILVTGGAGYMGSVLVPLLLDLGHKVTLYDNFTFGIKPALHFIAHPNLDIVEGDIRNGEAVAKAVKSADCVMHLAAIVGFPACQQDPIKAKQVNLDGSLNVVRALSQSQIAIFASTGSAYGNVEGICDETSAISPLTLYGETKAEAERHFLESGGIGLRFATVFGVSPRLRLDLLINDFVYMALHNRQVVLFEGHFRRTFLHIKDAARSWIISLQNHEKMKGQAYNIGDERMNFTKLDIAKKVAEKVDYYLHEAPVGQDLDKRDYEVSYAKIKKEGFGIEMDISAGIDELIKVLRHVRITSEWRNV